MCGVPSRGTYLDACALLLAQGTFIMPPTAVWSFVPLVEYHAGGGAASFWPPSMHIDEYELALAMHMSFGVAACYRGPGKCSSACCLALHWHGCDALF